MTKEEAQVVARELVESAIQRMELERLNYLNSLREHEAQLTIRRNRMEQDVEILTNQLVG